MRKRLPIVLSVTALIVAILGWTSIGESAREATVQGDGGPDVTRELAGKKHNHAAATKVVSHHTTIDPAQSGGIVAKCPKGWLRTGGGAALALRGGALGDTPNASITADVSQGKAAWVGAAHNNGAEPVDLWVDVVCVKKKTTKAG